MWRGLYDVIVEVHEVVLLWVTGCCWRPSIVGLVVVKLLGLFGFLTPSTIALLVALLFWLAFAVANGFWRVLNVTLVVLILLGLAGFLGPFSIDDNDHVGFESNEALWSLASKESEAGHYWATKCVAELKQVKGSLENEIEYAAKINWRMWQLRRENIALLEGMEALKQELEAEKLKGNLQQVI